MLQVVGPAVVPRRGDFNSLDCQTAVSAMTGAKGILPGCKTGTARISADFAEQDRRAFSREYLRSAVAPDLAALWRDLGLKLQGESLAFDEAAPLAAIRKSITEARDNYGIAAAATRRASHCPTIGASITGLDALWERGSPERANRRQDLIPLCRSPRSDGLELGLLLVAERGVKILKCGANLFDRL
jgi:hypothetical protein